MRDKRKDVSASTLQHRFTAVFKLNRMISGENFKFFRSYNIFFYKGNEREWEKNNRLFFKDNEEKWKKCISNNSVGFHMRNSTMKMHIS